MGGHMMRAKRVSLSRRDNSRVWQYIKKRWKDRRKGGGGLVRREQQHQSLYHDFFFMFFPFLFFGLRFVLFPSLEVASLNCAYSPQCNNRL